MSPSARPECKRLSDADVENRCQNAMLLVLYQMKENTADREDASHACMKKKRKRRRKCDASAMDKAGPGKVLMAGWS